MYRIIVKDRRYTVTAKELQSIRNKGHKVIFAI